jgi:hypothetical protein
MEPTIVSSSVKDDAAITRLYDLARSGDTQSREFALLDRFILLGLLATYGGEIQRVQSHAA